MQGTPSSELAAELERCARLCERTAQLYVEQHGDGVRTDVVSSLLLASASLSTAGRAVDDGDGTTALMIASTLVIDAIAAAERRGLDESLRDCLVSLRRVAALCERELGQ